MSKRRQHFQGSRSAKKARRTPYRGGIRKTTSPLYQTPKASQELKFFDGSKGNTNLSATGAILDDSLLEIAAGTGESNRIGRKITVKKISIRGFFKAATATASANTGNRCRIIVYLDKQANGATAAVGDILEDADINGFRNLTNVGRFYVLYDKIMNVNNLAGAGNGTTDNYGEAHYGFQMHKSCSIPIEYSGTAGAITEFASNNIGVLAIDEESNAAIQYRWRVRFTDS